MSEKQYLGTGTFLELEEPKFWHQTTRFYNIWIPTLVNIEVSQQNNSCDMVKWFEIIIFTVLKLPHRHGIMPTSEFKVIGKEVVLTPKSEHYFSNILTRTSYIAMKWWCLLCTRHVAQLWHYPDYITFTSELVEGGQYLVEVEARSNYYFLGR
jgi:hypothetical protein